MAISLTTSAFIMLSLLLNPLFSTIFVVVVASGSTAFVLAVSSSIVFVLAVSAVFWSAVALLPIVIMSNNFSILPALIMLLIFSMSSFLILKMTPLSPLTLYILSVGLKSIITFSPPVAAVYVYVVAIINNNHLCILYHNKYNIQKYLNHMARFNESCENCHHLATHV